MPAKTSVQQSAQKSNQKTTQKNIKTDMGISFLYAGVIMFLVVMMAFIVIGLPFLTQFAKKSNRTDQSSQNAQDVSDGSSLPEGILASEVVFENPDTQEQITVVFDLQTATATVTSNDLDAVIFAQTIAASGARYESESGMILWNKGNDITLYTDERLETIVFAGSMVSAKHVLSGEDDNINTTNQNASNGVSPEIDLTVVDEQLLGAWEWKQTVKNGNTIVPQKDGAFSITFTDSGEQIGDASFAEGNLAGLSLYGVSGTTDCNGFFGSYGLKNTTVLESSDSSSGTIAFGPLASTMMYCEGSQETIFTQDIAQVDQYEVDAFFDLRLLLKNGQGVMHFVRQGQM